MYYDQRLRGLIGESPSHLTACAPTNPVSISGAPRRRPIRLSPRQFRNAASTLHFPDGSDQICCDYISAAAVRHSLEDICHRVRQDQRAQTEQPPTDPTTSMPSRHSTTAPGLRAQPSAVSTTSIPSRQPSVSPAEQRHLRQHLHRLQACRETTGHLVSKCFYNS